MVSPLIQYPSNLKHKWHLSDSRTAMLCKSHNGTRNIRQTTHLTVHTTEQLNKWVIFASNTRTSLEQFQNGKDLCCVWSRSQEPAASFHQEEKHMTSTMIRAFVTSLLLICMSFTQQSAPILLTDGGPRPTCIPGEQGCTPGVQHLN